MLYEEAINMLCPMDKLEIAKAVLHDCKIEFEDIEELEVFYNYLTTLSKDEVENLIEEYEYESTCQMMDFNF